MIGILAVQGAFVEHAHMLDTLGAEHFEIRKRADMDAHVLDALLLPGGESTVMEKLLRELELFDPLAERIRRGTPVFGTCAGMILLAKQVVNDTRTGFAAMDIAVRRNAYGRQLGSFSTYAPFAGVGVITSASDGAGIGVTMPDAYAGGTVTDASAFTVVGFIS